jgi:hypothetical protein
MLALLENDFPDCGDRDLAVEEGRVNLEHS